VAAQAYDAARILFDAMARATGVAPDPIKDAIAATKGFQGATGTITIDSDRNAQKPVVVVQIENGNSPTAPPSGAADGWTRCGPVKPTPSRPPFSVR